MSVFVKIERPAYGGSYIARHEGKVVLIKGAALPGETAEVIIESEKKDYLKARVHKIIDPSAHRIKPACKYFGACGGCQLQHMPYEMQINIKEEILTDCIRRLAKTDIRLWGPLIDDDPWNYRLRGQFKVSPAGTGLFRENSREVVDIDSCPLMTEEINALLEKIKAVATGPDIREVHITAGDCFNALIRILAGSRYAGDMKTLAGIFFDAGFSGVCIETHDNRMCLFGKTFVTLDLGTLKYTVSPMTFFQSHWGLNQRVAEFIRDSLEPLSGKKILDMYAGAGNFSIPLASDAEIAAIEENPYAVEDGRRNLKINGIRNCTFTVSTAENFRAKANFDAVILDPPRPGLSNRVMDRVLSLAPERVVYISCNPSTFARDLKKLTAKYDIESVRLIDFFPQTYHIESIALLSR